MTFEVSRRRFLELSSAFGGLVACGRLDSLFAQEKRLLTGEQALGSFYPITKPLDRNAGYMRLGKSYRCKRRLTLD